MNIALRGVNDSRQSAGQAEKPQKDQIVTGKIPRRFMRLKFLGAASQDGRT